MAENDNRYMYNSDGQEPRASLESPVQAPKNTERPPPAQRPPPRNSERPPRTAEQPPPRTAEQPPPRTAERPPKTAEHPPKTAERPPKTAERPPKTDERPPKTAEQPPKPMQHPPRTAEQPPRTAEKPKHAAQQPKDATQPRAAQQKVVQPPVESSRPSKQVEPSRNRDPPQKRPGQQQPRTTSQPRKAAPRRRMNKNDDSFIARMREMATLWKIASILFLIGFLFNVISYATPHWLDYTNAADEVVGIGLWSTCTTLSSCKFRGLASNCLNTLRGFGGVAVLQCVMVVPLLVGYINRPASRRCTAITVIIVCSLTAICIQIVATSFTRSSGCSDSGLVAAGRWSWSLALAVVAILFLTAAAVLFFVQELRICSAYKKGQHPRRTLGAGIRVT